MDFEQYKKHSPFCVPSRQIHGKFEKGNYSSKDGSGKIQPQVKPVSAHSTPGQTRLQEKVAAADQFQNGSNADQSEESDTSSSNSDKNMISQSDEDSDNSDDNMISESDSDSDNSDDNMISESDSNSDDEDTTDSNSLDNTETYSNIWKMIKEFCIETKSSALDGFRHWYRFCHGLEMDPTIAKIMETLRVLRDEDKSLSYRDALHDALMKRKYLILETLRVHPEGIWEIIYGDRNKAMDVFQDLTYRIIACRSIKHDPLFASVNEMIEEKMSGRDPMDFEEALNHTIEEKADAIFNAVGELPYQEPSYIWDRIKETFNDLNPFSEVEYFVNIYNLIKKDPTFQIVLAKINEYSEAGEILDAALYKSVKENEALIRKSFSIGGELWESIKTDDFGGRKEDIDVFKMYVLYYLSMKNDELFKRIITDTKKRKNKGSDDALNRTIQWNKVDIMNAVDKPYVPGVRFLHHLPPPM